MGLFTLAERMFDISITSADGEAPVWHPDVRYFPGDDSCRRASGPLLSRPYSRPAEKRGGAWMDECLNRGKFERFGAFARGLLWFAINHLQWVTNPA
jgi:oligopeptidase A